MKSKFEIRKEVKNKVKMITLDDRTRASKHIQQSIEKLPEFANSQNILLYYSMNNEVCTVPYLQKWYKTKNIYLPLVKGDSLVIKKYNGEQSLREGSFHIMEPLETETGIELNKIDLVIVPAVSLNRKGGRIGHGKGYYDRLLSKSNVITVGIIFDCQLCDDFLTEKHDVRMNYVITEKETIKVF